MSTRRTPNPALARMGRIIRQLDQCTRAELRYLQDTLATLLAERDAEASAEPAE